MSSFEENSHRTIVLADDDRDLLQLVKMRLEADGFNVAISVNAENISRIVVEQHADIILLDISMDGISGEEVCRELKKHKKTSFIPVVLFSANADIREVAATCGADDYVAKPFSIEAIREKLMKLIPAFKA